MKSFLLPAAPNDRARTFYGKAVVVEEENGGRLLLSYGVPVCRITSDGEFIRIWPGYSATTMRHLQTLQVEIGYNETRAAAIVTYSEKLQELQKVDNTPIKTGYISYLSFVLDGNYYYYQIDENPFFDFHYIKTPVKSGRRSCDAIYKNDKKEWVADCFFTSFCTNEEVKTAAGYIFDMLTSAPVSKIRLDTKRRRVPNLYDGGYHYETVAAPERFSKIDFLEGC